MRYIRRFGVEHNVSSEGVISLGWPKKFGVRIPLPA